jgi:apolipoprotein N-acyltransferase
MIMDFIKKYKNLIFLLISSLFIFLSYPKYSFSPLVFVSLIPYIIVIFDIKNHKQALKYGFIYGFATYTGILYWIYYTMRASDVNIFFSAISLILLSLILSIEFIIITLISYATKKCSYKILIFVLPSIWVTIDFLKVTITKYIAYFPWFMLSYSQWNNPYILNLSGVFGNYFITFLIVFINTILALIFLDQTKKEKLKKLITAIIIIFASIIYGRERYLFLEKCIEKSNKTLRIATIQPSIDFYKKWNINYIEEIKLKIENLLKEVSLKKPDIIIWPENALYGWIDDPDVFEWLCSNIKKTKTYHIVGSVSKFDRKYVSAYLIDTDCRIVSHYNKRVLVPFGEYVPMRNLLGKFINVVSTLGEFESGSFNQEPLKFKDIYILQTICYETAFDYLFNSDKKTSFIVNITNDGWYLNTSAPYQHFAIAVIRAVENQKTLIRAANNGISAAIYPDGKIKSILNLNEYNFIVEDIPLKECKTNTHLKNIIVYISFLILGAFFLAMIFRR